MLKKKEIDLIDYSIVNTKEILIQYIPNTAPYGKIYTLRLILPLRRFTRLGKEYLLAWFSGGGSLSQKGAGFRLYLTMNIRVVRTVKRGLNPKYNFDREPTKLELFRLIKNIED
jgi:hypothetical protein